MAEPLRKPAVKAEPFWRPWQRRSPLEGGGEGGSHLEEGPATRQQNWGPMTGVLSRSPAAAQAPVTSAALPTQDQKQMLTGPPTGHQEQVSAGPPTENQEQVLAGLLTQEQELTGKPAGSLETGRLEPSRQGCRLKASVLEASRQGGQSGRQFLL